MGVTLVSLNIERAKHYERILPFLKEQSPDMVCVQELYERDFEMFERELGMFGIFEPLGLHPVDPPEEGETMEGIAVFSRSKIIGHEVHFYAGSENAARADGPVRKAVNRPVLFVEIESGGIRYDIGTTHFTWTPDGGANDQQRADLARLMAILEEKDSFVLCGDFNAPRGGEIFSTIAEKYTDNIPPHYEWSIDLSLHRAGGGKIQADAAALGQRGFMVDGMFSTADYALRDVFLKDGLSDHMGIVATVAKA